MCQYRGACSLLNQYEFLKFEINYMKINNINITFIKLVHGFKRYAQVWREHGIFYATRKTSNFIKNKILLLNRPLLYVYPGINSKKIHASRIELLLKEANIFEKKIFIVIPSYNDYVILKSCIQSIREYGSNLVEKIIISDDASTMNVHKEYLRTLSLDPDVVVILNKTNKGFSATVNRGFLSVPAEADLLLLNSDTELREGAIQALMATAKKFNALVGSRLLYSNGTIQHAGGFRNFNKLDLFDHSNRLRDGYFPPAIECYDSLFCTGAALYISSEVRAKIGEFDENFQMGCEDVDYCLRAWRHDIRVMYCGSSEIIHHESLTRGAILKPRDLASKEYFWKKNANFFENRKLTSNFGESLEINFVLKDTDVCGEHRVIFNFCNHLARSGYSVNVWSLAHKPDWFELDSRVVFLDYNSFGELEKDLTNRDGLKVATWWETAEVVWRSSVRRGLSLWLAQDIENSYCNGEDYANELKAIASFRPEFIYIVNYKWMQSIFTSDFNYHTNFVGVGIDEKIFFRKQISKKDKSLLVWARGEPIKGFGYSKELLKVFYDCGYTVSAYGVDETLINDLPFVKFFKKPTDDKLCDLYNENQFFLQTSVHEGLSLPQIEAMNCHCIPLVTDSYVNRDGVELERNRIILTRKLHKDADLIRSICYSALISEMLPEMLHAVSEFGWNISFSRISLLIESIAKDPQYGRTNYLNL